MKFVDQLPADGRRGVEPIDVDQLRAALGRWAEVARYPKSKRNTAASRGHQFAARHAGIQYATRSIGDEVVLFVRAVAR